MPDVSLFHDGLGPSAALIPEGSKAPDGVSAIHYGVEKGIGGALEVLGHEGIVRVLVEAGPGLLAALWDEQLIDELVLVHAGGVAGAQAPGLFEGSSASPDRIVGEMRAVETGISGEDAVTVWRPRR